ncbi:hypothetical protein Ahy_B08g092536 isoform B [Arachis hypogaea]|uniref:Uncharacterized protein n=1 Tax=Arachis hypogaea TaxID=3818 RepID=A0A444Y444_ARAHY|nr:hypothetical protein Ahy_B08g092536 isoform B [Arachis hypogaea]
MPPHMMPPSPAPAKGPKDGKDAKKKTASKNGKPAPEGAPASQPKDAATNNGTAEKLKSIANKDLNKSSADEESKTVDLVEPLPGGQRTKRFMRGLLNLMILSKKGTRTCSSETRRGIGYKPEA